ncbi:hypothetical protein NLI96_g425 [Meripilus lineatus]|uniref:Uncharacterized protein n=1 Tax=Meripilus lineatus TaxID=2056292 RepID=A0AAD5VCB7_9APHY|nr:hypothetical protein NLI96_g425 [Physisporinus lineatus]
MAKKIPKDHEPRAWLRDQGHCKGREVKEPIFGKALLEGNQSPIIRGHNNGAAQNTLQAIGACESPAVARISVKETRTLWSRQGQEEAYRSKLECSIILDHLAPKERQAIVKEEADAEPIPAPQRARSGSVVSSHPPKHSEVTPGATHRSRTTTPACPSTPSHIPVPTPRSSPPQTESNLKEEDVNDSATPPPFSFATNKRHHPLSRRMQST